jgi:hypothetical protein
MVWDLLFLSAGDVTVRRCAKVERVVLNALPNAAALSPDICAFGEATIVFREADPPWPRIFIR